MSWHTPGEAAPLLGLHVKNVRALCAAGRLRHRRIGPRGGKLQISDQAIADYLAACEQGGPGTEAPAPARASKPRVITTRPDGKPLRYQWGRRRA